jgi:uncharacterized GH25 family protein
MKVVWSFASIFSLLSFVSPPIQAHDGWVESSPIIVEKGQPVSLLLMHGNHSNEHRSFRIAGKWEPKYTKLLVISPQGKEEDLTEKLVDLGEDEEKTGPKGPKGFHLASFTPKEEGVYHALVRQVRTLQHGDGPKFLSIKTAKTTFSALNVPMVSATKKLKGFDRAIGGESGLEIVPVINPLGLFPGDPITLEVRYKGNPISGKVVSLIRRIDGAASAQDETTDDKGRVTFTVGPADFYLARVKFDEKSERLEGQYDLSTYEATYVFQVFNRP